MNLLHSFNYEGTPFMFNIWDKFIMVKNNKLWEYGAGDYNQFFGETKPYYTKFIANQDFLKEKIFTNLEFIADSYDSDNNLLYTIPYDYIKVSTHLDYDKSYQFGTTNLTEEIVNLHQPNKSLEYEEPCYPGL